METFTNEPRDIATEVPKIYKRHNFVSKILSQLNPDISWDLTHPKRLQITTKSYTKEELNEDDFQAYLASSSSEEDAEAENNNEEVRREKIRGKFAELLEGYDEEADSDTEPPVQSLNEENLEITFTPGLSEKAHELLEKKKLRDGERESAIKGKTVFEQYRDKKKAKNKALKQQEILEKGEEYSDDDYPEDEAEFDGKNDPKNSKKNNPRKKNWPKKPHQNENSV